MPSIVCFFVCSFLFIVLVVVVLLCDAIAELLAELVWGFNTFLLFLSLEQLSFAVLVL